jgi:hypothetical protein
LIKLVGTTEILEKHLLRCHCGEIEIELTLPNGIESPRRCNCSMCRRRGTIVGSVLLDQLRIIKGHTNLRCYQFNTNTAKHYFCSTCGIYTHHQRRSNPNEYGYNVACLDEVDPFLIGDVPTADGVNHPSDR